MMCTYCWAAVSARIIRIHLRSQVPNCGEQGTAVRVRRGAFCNLLIIVPGMCWGRWFVSCDSPRHVVGLCLIARDAIRCLKRDETCFVLSQAELLLCLKICAIGTQIPLLNSPLPLQSVQVYIAALFTFAPVTLNPVFVFRFHCTVFTPI
jgi:hypothetical protein